MKINIDFWRSILAIKSTPTATEDKSYQGQISKPLVPGQQVRGEVLARLSEQVVILKIGTEVFRADISVPLRPGESVNLTFQGSDPRPSFSMQQGTANPSPVKLSPAASLLNEVILKAPTPSSNTSTTIARPLLQTSPNDTAAFSISLRNSLVFSGLFYESHLLQWFVGERQLSELLKEPQARFSLQKRKDSTNAVLREVKNLTVSDFLAKQIDEGGDKKECLKDQGGEHVNDTSFHAASILREQAQTLLSGVFRWQGEVWPDQRMEWDVEKNDTDQESDNSQSWRTRLRLHLPNLGTVNATLMLTDEGISGLVTTSLQAACDLMQNELDTLKGSLSESGLKIREMEVSYEENQ